MRSLYKKSELAFSIVWIVAYCVLMSLSDSLSETVGIEKAVTLPISVLLSLLLYFFIKQNSLSEKYGFCKAEVIGSFPVRSSNKILIL